MSEPTIEDLRAERNDLRGQLTRLVEALHTGRTDAQRLINAWRDAESMLRLFEDTYGPVEPSPQFYDSAPDYAS